LRSTLAWLLTDVAIEPAIKSLLSRARNEQRLLLVGEPAEDSEYPCTRGTHRCFATYWIILKPGRKTHWWTRWYSGSSWAIAEKAVLVGMLLRGTAESSIVHFVSSREVHHLIQLAESDA